MPRWSADRGERVQITVRIKRSARDEVDRLASLHPDPAVDRSAVLRAALGHGLPVVARLIERGTLPVEAKEPR